jgi:hypothetical protein
MMAPFGWMYLCDTPSSEPEISLPERSSRGEKRLERRREQRRASHGCCKNRRCVLLLLVQVVLPHGNKRSRGEGVI